MEDFPLGPPPAYHATQHVTGHSTTNKHTKDSRGFESEDPPPYKKDKFSREPLSSFQFVSPHLTRPWGRFFTLCLKCRWSLSAENFGYNLTYYQLNYAWMVLILVLVAAWVINSYDFNIYLVWTSITITLVYMLNVSGFNPRLLGRKLSLAEQLTVLVMFSLPCYGLLPEAFSFIFFIGAFTCFVIVHACFTPAVNKATVGIYEL